MSKREIKFTSYATHSWLKRLYTRLNAPERDLAMRFIRDHDHLDRNQFDLAVNRMFLNKEKPKGYLLILELLSCCNS